MTITSAPVRQSFDGDGSVTAFAIPWKYFAKSDVVVTLRDSSNVEALQIISTHYTLTAAGVDSGGTCTMVTAPATGEVLVITLDPPNTQASPLPPGGPFPSSTVENALDKLTQLVANLDERFNRAMLVPETDTQIGANLLIPIDSDRATKFLGWDSNGKVIAASSVSNDVTITSFMETLLDDADAVAGRQTLLLDKSGADIASAATIDLDAATGDFVDVTGTTPITAITLADGVEKTVRFTGILLLTDGASLVLPGSVTIRTAAGDIAVFRGDASSVVRCVSYQRDGSQPYVQHVRKTADETVNNSTTLQDDDDLKVHIKANESIAFTLFLIHTAGATDDVKLNFTIPSGATIAFQNEDVPNSTLSSGDLVVPGLDNTGQATINGFLDNGATAGDMQLQWAQNSLVAADTKVLKNSLLKIYR